MTSPSALKRCAIYTLVVCAAGPDAGDATATQHDVCREYIQRQPGWRLVETRYDDQGVSSRSAERPAFHRLLADLAAGAIDIVVVTTANRLAGSLTALKDLFARLDAVNARFVAVYQAFDSGSRFGRLLLNLLDAFTAFDPDEDEDEPCAIYTRVRPSTGLTSLDAQRAACAAYAQQRPDVELVDEHDANVADVEFLEVFE